MAKQLLNENGVKNKQDELFALNNAQLDTHVTALLSDFKAWINTEFALSTEEEVFLNAADPDFLRLLSSVIAVSIRNRIPVAFTKSTIITAVKRFDTEAAFNFNYSWGGSLSDSSTVKLNIVYS